MSYEENNSRQAASQASFYEVKERALNGGQVTEDVEVAREYLRLYRKNTEYQVGTRRSIGVAMAALMITHLEERIALLEFPGDVAKHDETYSTVKSTSRKPAKKAKTKAKKKK